MHDSKGDIPLHQGALNKVLADCQQLKEELLNKLK
jgi:hypothetical protein